MSAFNGSMGFLPGSQMGRRNARQQQPAQPMYPTVAGVQYAGNVPTYADTSQMLPSSPEPAVKPARAAMTPSTQPATQPSQPQMSVYQRQAIAANMANRVANNTRAAANPATAGLPHVQAAMAGRNIMNEMEAERMGMGQNYFQGREMVADANIRANESNQANVGQTNAQTDMIRQQTTGMRQMLPGQVMAQDIANQGANQGVARSAIENQYLPGQLDRQAESEKVKNQYLPGQLQGQLAQQRAETNQTNIKTNQIGAETSRIAAGNDPKTLATLQKNNADLQSQLNDMRKQNAALLAQMQKSANPIDAALNGGNPPPAPAPQPQNAAPQPNARKFAQGQKPQDGWKPGDEATTPQGTFRFDANGSWVKVS